MHSPDLHIEHKWPGSPKRKHFPQRKWLYRKNSEYDKKCSGTSFSTPRARENRRLRGISLSGNTLLLKRTPLWSIFCLYVVIHLALVCWCVTCSIGVLASYTQGYLPTLGCDTLSDQCGLPLHEEYGLESDDEVVHYLAAK